MRHGDNLIQRPLTLHVHAIAYHDDHPSRVLRRASFQHLFLAGRVNRIVQGLASAGFQIADFIVQLFRVVGKFLEHRAGGVKSLEEDLVLAGPPLQHLKNELAGRVLLKLQLAPGTVRGVNDQPDTKGRTRPAEEVLDRLRLAVLVKLEVLLREVDYEMTPAIKHADRYVDHLHANRDVTLLAGP